jgi:hypothetical protein
MAHQVWNQEASEYTGQPRVNLVGVGAPSRTSQSPEPVATSDPGPKKRDPCVRLSSHAE